MIMQTTLKTVMGFLDKPTSFLDQLSSNDSRLSSSCDQLAIMTNVKTRTRGQFHTRVLEGGLLQPDYVLLPGLSNVHIVEKLHLRANLRRRILGLDD